MQVKIVSRDAEALAAMMNQVITDAYAQGRQTERERIRSRGQIAAEKTWPAGDWYVGPQDHILEKFVDALLEDDDE